LPLAAADAEVDALAAAHGGVPLVADAHASEAATWPGQAVEVHHSIIHAQD
jgi:hypothetical protein